MLLKLTRFSLCSPNRPPHFLQFCWALWYLSGYLFVYLFVTNKGIWKETDFLNFIFIILTKWEDDIDHKREKKVTWIPSSLFLFSLSSFFSLSLLSSLSFFLSYFCDCCRVNMSILPVIKLVYTSFIPQNICTLQWQPIPVGFQLPGYTSWCLRALFEPLSSLQCHTAQEGNYSPGHSINSTGVYKYPSYLSSCP